jgi:hypothetical protein
MPFSACGRSEFLRTERIRSLRLVPPRKRPEQLRTPLNKPEVARSKFLRLISLGVSSVLVVIAAGSLLGDPNHASTSAVASMGLHALATIVLRVPQ